MDTRIVEEHSSQSSEKDENVFGVPGVTAIQTQRQAKGVRHIPPKESARGRGAGSHRRSPEDRVLRLRHALSYNQTGIRRCVIHSGLFCGRCHWSQRQAWQRLQRQ